MAEYIVSTLGAGAHFVSRNNVKRLLWDYPQPRHPPFLFCLLQSKELASNHSSLPISGEWHTTTLCVLYFSKNHAEHSTTWGCNMLKKSSEASFTPIGSPSYRMRQSQWRPFWSRVEWGWGDDHDSCKDAGVLTTVCSPSPGSGMEKVTEQPWDLTRQLSCTSNLRLPSGSFLWELDPLISVSLSHWLPLF